MIVLKVPHARLRPPPKMAEYTPSAQLPNPPATTVETLLDVLQNPPPIVE